jgi:hypothetical protein
MYFKDHNPPHVHVYFGNAKNHEASMILELGTWEVLAVDGFSESDVKRVIKELSKSEKMLKEKWNEYQE